jgi:REP element-mobilizing transposase RayT
MKKNLFRKNNRHFHINLDFASHAIFKDLDWIFIQKKTEALCIEFNVNIHALIMMDTHIHILMNANDKNEHYFCEKLQQEINPLKNYNENHCEPIGSYPQYLNTYRYIHRNPIDAGLVAKAEDYLYSSLRMTLGYSASHCRIVDHLGLIYNPVRLLNWINKRDDFRPSQLSLFDNLRG